jgi:hypothetical protein
MILIYIADGDDLTVRLPEKSTQVGPALPTGANYSDSDSIPGGRSAARVGGATGENGGRGNGERRGSQKLTAGKRFGKRC